MTTIKRLAIASLVGVSWVTWATISHAQEPAKAEPAKPAPSAPASAEPSSSDPAKPAGDLTLDELLGLPDAAPRDAAPKPDQRSTSNPNLDRQLSPDQPEQDPFKIAVQLMDESAKRLAPATADAGLDTQRLQEEAILRLDQLIAQAKKQKSKPKPKPNQQQQQQPQDQNQQQDASSQRQQQQSKPVSQAAQDTQTGPAGQQAQTRTPPAGAGAAWGSLPEHVRDALLQGSSDRFSSAYRGLTEEYYKRLAQDPAARSGSPTAPPQRPQSTPPTPPATPTP